jgi:hypothetical protein
MARKQEPTYPVFTEDELRDIRWAAQSVWNDIGWDCLQALAEHGFKKPRDIQTVSYRRSEVMEMVIDANRMDDDLKKTPGLLEKWNGLDYKQMIRIVRPAFPHDRYGL